MEENMENISELSLKILGIYGAIFAPIATSPEKIEQWVCNTFSYFGYSKESARWSINDFVKLLGIELYFLYFFIELRTPLIKIFGTDILILNSSFNYYSSSFAFLFLVLHLFLPNLSTFIKSRIKTVRFMD